MFAFHSIEQYQADLARGRTSCEEAVRYYLQQIAGTESLNAFTEVYATEALEKASVLDRQRQSGQAIGRLHGVILGIKDVICYKDHAVTASSRILQGFHSLYTATALDRLIQEEAIVIGSLNCDEFAMGSSNENSVYGPVRNALDPFRVPGGSSGGSAVAVQAGLCMASLGSDTGGSVRQPADFCGIIGLKPSYGRISRYGLIAYASSFDQIGILSQSVEDAALLLSIMAGPDEFDSTVSRQSVPKYEELLRQEEKENYRFAYFPETLEHQAIDPEISNAIRETIVSLRKKGHKVDPVPFPLLDFIVPAYYVLTTAEASSNLSRYDGVRFGYRSTAPSSDLESFYSRTRSEGFGMEVKRRILLGTFVLSAGYYDAYYTRAQQVRRLLKDQATAVFQSYDFLIMPNSPVTAFRIGEKTDDPISMYLADIYTVMANLVGSPAISLPLYRHSNGMPFGLQLMAGPMDEVSLLRISARLLREYGISKM